MASLILLFVLTIAASGGSLADVKSTRIIGGELARSGQFPYQAAIMSPSGTVICGGSILSKNFILTAGQCVEERHASFLRVMVGSNTITPPGVIHQVKTKFVHPDYLKYKLDIALLELETPLEYSYTVNEIKIYEGIVSDGEEVTISGWGGTGDRISNQLKYIKEELGGDLCSKRRDSIFDSKYVQCLSHKNGTGFCGTDVGGPAKYKDELLGVAIFVNGKCGLRPNGYQKIAFFRDWINKIALV